MKILGLAEISAICAPLRGSFFSFFSKIFKKILSFHNNFGNLEKWHNFLFFGHLQWNLFWEKHDFVIKIWGENLIIDWFGNSVSTLYFSSSISRRNMKFFLVVDFGIKFENFGVGRNFCHLRASERFIFFFFQILVKNVGFSGNWSL